jgi:hypothetical protein
MSGINEEVAANKPGAAGPRPDAATACDDEAEPAADYMAVGGVVVIFACGGKTCGLCVCLQPLRMFN